MWDAIVILIRLLGYFALFMVGCLAILLMLIGTLKLAQRMLHRAAGRTDTGTRRVDRSAHPPTQRRTRR